MVICDVNEQVGQATAAELGPRAAFYKVNVADRAAVQVWVDDSSPDSAASTCW